MRAILPLNRATDKDILEALRNRNCLKEDGQKILVESISGLNKSAYKDVAKNYAKQRKNITSPQKNNLDYIYKYINSTFDKKTLKVLDIGCGHGIELQYLNEFKNIECCAVENEAIFKNMLPKDIECIDADMLELPFDDNSYQAILHHGTLHHLPWFLNSSLGITQALREAIRVLAPQGILSIVVKQQNIDSFDETGRFFSLMQEGILQELLLQEGVSIINAKTIHNTKARDGWKDWIRITAIKKREA